MRTYIWKQFWMEYRQFVFAALQNGWSSLGDQINIANAYRASGLTHEVVGPRARTTPEDPRKFGAAWLPL